MFKMPTIRDLLNQHLLLDHFAKKIKENPNYNSQTDVAISCKESKGNDGSPVLIVVFDNKTHAQYLVDHLFEKPYSIGSKTKTNQKKNVQHENDLWTVWIALDQLDDYCIKAFSAQTPSSSPVPILIPLPSAPAISESILIPLPSASASSSSRPTTATSTATRPATATSSSSRPTTATSTATRPATATSSSSRPTTTASSAPSLISLSSPMSSNRDYVIDLNQFLRSFSLKEHIHKVMSDTYGAKFKGAITRWKVTRDNSLLIHIRHLKESEFNAHTYAQHFIQYLNQYIGWHTKEFGITHSKAPYQQKLDLTRSFDSNTLPRQSKGHYRFYVRLTAEAFFDYIRRVQINGIYFHYTLDELFHTFVFKTKSKSSDPNELLHYAVQRLLGKICFEPNAKKDFKWTYISLGVIKQYLQVELGTSDFALDVEDSLEEKLCSLIEGKQVIMTNLQASINDTKAAHYKDLYWELGKMKNPGTNRAIHGPKNKTQFRSNPLLVITQEHSTKRHQGTRGTSKPEKLHAKRRAGSKPPRSIGQMKRYPIAHGILLFFDINECIVRHKLVFPANANTNSQWHQQGTFDLNAISLLQLDNEAETKAVQGIFDWNEIQYDYPFKGLRGLGTPVDDITFRLNVLSAVCEAKSQLQIEHEIPVRIVPEGKPHRKYSYDERLQDALEALDSRAKEPVAHALICRNNYELLAFIFNTYGRKTKNLPLRQRVLAACLRLNLRQVLVREANLRIAIEAKDIDNIFDIFIGYAAENGSRSNKTLLDRAVVMIHAYAGRIFSKRKEQDLLEFYKYVFLLRDNYFVLDDALNSLLSLRYFLIIQRILEGLIATNPSRHDYVLDDLIEDKKIITQVLTRSIEEPSEMTPELVLQVIEKLTLARGILITWQNQAPSPFQAAVRANNYPVALRILKLGLATQSSSGPLTVAFIESTNDRAAGLLLFAVQSKQPDVPSIEFLCHNGADAVPALEWALVNRPWILQFLPANHAYILTDLLIRILAATLPDEGLVATSQTIYQILLHRHHETPIRDCDASLFALGKIAVRTNVPLFLSVLRWGLTVDWQTDESSPIYFLLREKIFPVLTTISNTLPQLKPILLFCAVKVSDDAGLIRELLKLNFNPDTKKTALRIALEKKHFEAAKEILKNLLEAKVQKLIDPTDPANTTLHLAVEAHLGGIIDEPTLFALTRQSFSIYQANSAGITPLDMACTSQDFALMEKLIGSSGENPREFPDAKEFVSAKMAGEEVRLHKVSRSKDPASARVARWLCVNGAEATVVNDRGITPFITAINEGNFIIAEIIIDYCIQQISEREKDKAIFLLTRAGQNELALKLLDAMQSQCSYRDADTRQSALHFARVPRLLTTLARQFEVASPVDADGKTPIDLMLARGEYENLEIFIGAAPKKFSPKDFNAVVNRLIGRVMFTTALQIINIAGDYFQYNTDVNSLITIVVRRTEPDGLNLLEKLCESCDDILRENDHKQNVVEVALQNADKPIVAVLLKHVRVVLNPIKASRYLIALVCYRFYDLAVELVARTAVFSLQTFNEVLDFIPGLARENLELLYKLIEKQPDLLQFKMAESQTVFRLLVASVQYLTFEQYRSMILGLLKRFGAKLSNDDKYYCLWHLTSSQVADLQELFNLLQLEHFDPYYSHQNKTLCDLVVESHRIVDFECLLGKIKPINQKLLHELIALIIKYNRHDFLPVLFLNVQPLVPIMREASIQDYGARNSQTISRLVIESIANDNLPYLSFVCEVGFRVTSEVFDQALEKASSPRLAHQPLRILLRKSHSFDPSNAKAKLAGHRLAESLEVPIDFFTESVFSEQQKRLATTAMAFERIRCAKNGDDVISVINVLWNNTTFFKQPEGLKLPFSDTWQKNRVHEEWMWVVKSAKNKLLELTQSSDTDLTAEQVSFINNEHDFTKVAQSMKIYSIFSESKIRPDQKQQLQTQANALLQDEQKKFSVYQLKFNKNDA